MHYPWIWNTHSQYTEILKICHNSSVIINVPRQLKSNSVTKQLKYFSVFITQGNEMTPTCYDDRIRYATYGVCYL